MTENQNQSGKLMIIAEQPPVGDNTTLMLNMATMTAVENYVPALYYSMGKPKVDVCNRLISIVTGIDYKTISEGKLNEEEWKKLDEKIHSLMKSPLFIEDSTELTVSTLCEQVSWLVSENGLKLVEIDHMSRMTADDRTFGNEQERIEYITRKLRSLAHGLGITIIAVQD